MILPMHGAGNLTAQSARAEGDAILSIILSKALLAPDDKIKDPSIVAQLMME